MGEPFMESLTNNKPLLYSLGVSGGTIVALASGLVPEATEYFELVPLPDEFRNVVIGVVTADIFGAFIIDRILSFIFGTSKMKKR